MNQLKDPIGPRGWPLLGSMLEARRDPLAFTLRLAREYGDVARFHLGPYKGYLVSDPEGVRRVLQANHRNYDKQNYDYEMLRLFVGEGLLTADGQHWLEQRRLMQPMFARGHLKSFSGAMYRPIQRMVESWREVANKDKVIDVAHEMNRLALEIVSRFLFGSSMHSHRDQVIESFEVLNHEVARRFQSLLALPLWVPSPRNLAARRAIDRIDEVLEKLVANRDDTDSDGGLLRALTEAHGGDQGDSVQDRKVRDEIVTLTLAGHETTAALLSWTWYLLALHPDVAQRVRQEVDGVVGGRAPSAEDLENLTFTDQVLKESMRLYPPVWIVSRRAKQSDQISGYRIPADGVVAVSPYATHRHPRYWERPEHFDPTRFEPERERERHPFAYVPFGGGPRLCIGGAFALMEAKMVVASLVQRYQLDLEDPQSVRPEPLVTLRPEGGLLMRIHPVGA